MNSTMENKILIPKNPEVQISKALQIGNRKYNKMHVKLTEDKKGMILTGAHDYTIISPSDLEDYEDPVTFCTNHIEGICDLVEKTMNRIDNEVTRIYVGWVIHFYAKLSVAVIDLTGKIKIGSHIMFEGTKSSFTQELREMEIDHKKVTFGTGRVAVKVDLEVRPGYKVYRIPKIDNSKYVQHIIWS